VPKAGIPDGIVWAVETLDISPADHVLEIGCGHGLAVPLVCEKLGRGTLTAIDRSPKMIAATEKRNRGLVLAGEVRFETTALSEAKFGRRRFSKIFAVNVNLFWINATAELPVIAKVLRPGGALYLFYQPPSAAQLKSIAAKLARNLESGGFIVDRTVFGPKGCMCFVAHTGKEAHDDPASRRHGAHRARL
jgi:SAM-dependent methyltransferase